MKRNVLLGTLFITFLTSFCVEAQNDGKSAPLNNTSKVTYGVRGGIGILNDNLLDNKVYIPMALWPNMGYLLSKDVSKDYFQIYAEPQLVIVYLKSAREPGYQDVELGLNVGLEYTLFFKDLGGFVSLASGPNFITVDTRQQEEGFVFSDNFSLGGKLKLKNAGLLSLFVRFRHLSNLNLDHPNKGINNMFLGVGYGSR